MSNLYMFVTLNGPSRQFSRDTVNMILAAPDGLWLGKGPGKLRQLRLLYRKNIRFGEPGMYTILLEQAMRRSPLQVTDVGLRIERVNP
jgi:gliding motility-associated lipoprotein GldH